MKKLLLILFVVSFNLTFGQIELKINGKIIDEDFNKLAGVIIKNLNDGRKYYSDQNGEFELKAKLKDTLQFEYLSLKTEKIILDITDQNIYLIMVEDYYPCFGTEETYEKFEKSERKRLKKLYATADKKGVWKK